ncbi:MULTISPECIES: hypothetical protein [Streptomyces]|uniref:HEPN domain-containing protein n=1 Tax=Streptomyces lycii TaxID=2654337 RepID=A0ABQ7FGK9_9ACTN|nr:MULTISPECIES: hypothetical protein [Streptomyces]KAF4407504.1 hypothetical protein GCU69_19140 [Streptomyces lycii]PGH52196.1 hypothetical protein CRI70_02645 [Streptomyces sp. Ru87]
MSDVVDADELLRRIRAARDWAAEREAGSREQAGDADRAEAFAASMNFAAFSAVREVLDRIIDPANHPG